MCDIIHLNYYKKVVSMKYTNDYTNEISFPLGGIGSGCIGLGGDGRLIDWEIFNRPSKGSRNGRTHIAVKAVTKDGVKVKILNSDLKKNFSGSHPRFGFGADIVSMCGFPHFKNLIFDAEFPIATLIFSDDDFPAEIKLTSFNPMIPLDDKNSSLPCAFFNVEIKNTSSETIEYQTAFSVQNPFDVSLNKSVAENGFKMIHLSNAGVNSDDINYGDLTIASSADALAQTYWYRGAWQDAIVTFMNEFSSRDDIKDRVYSDTGRRDVCTLAVKTVIAPGEIKKAAFVLSWNIPNNYNYWSECLDENGKNKTWKNYYATIFPDSVHSAIYAMSNAEELYRRTKLFADTLAASTLDPSIADAVSANLAVLKSPVVLRLEDGSFYGWEGLDEDKGSCEGTCQHVWNYAYALCFLFPQLERSIRDLEFKYSTLESGQMIFRLKLPLGRDCGDFRACLDGQMGSVIKCYREWKISGDDDWLQANYDNITKVLDYAHSPQNKDCWDLNCDGVLEGRQHHTLDMELFGPSSWLEGMYLTALKAASEMAEYLGDGEKSAEYKKLFENGCKYLKTELWNGRYFIQKIDLNDTDMLNQYEDSDSYRNEETGEIKYQIGEGSSIDQMLAQWHANLLGLGDIFDRSQVKTALKNMMKYNFIPSMRDFANPWRVFSLNDDAGSVICAYPADVYKPKIPIPYCEETMTGFEYSFAGLLAENGMIDDCIRVVKAVRDRYDGKKRNPWNEIECGSNYARSMASFALLPIFSGFEFDLPHGYIGFDPLVNADNFKCFWSLGSGWGDFSTSVDKIRLDIFEGELSLSSFGVKFADKISHVLVDGKDIEFTFENGMIHFGKITVDSYLEAII